MKHIGLRTAGFLAITVSVLILFTTIAQCAVPPKVTLGFKGEMAVDGKPVFPQAIYVAYEPRWLDMAERRMVLAELDELKNSPFRLLINYGDPTGTPSQKNRLLDEMHKRGLYDLFSVKDYFQGKEFDSFKQYIIKPGAKLNYPTAEEEVLRTVVRAVKSHPAVLGWYIWDEAPKNPEEVKAHNRWVIEEDKMHPTFMVLNIRKADGILPYAGAANILGIDDYPAPDKPITRVAQTMDELQKANINESPTWFVLQTFGDYQYREDVRENKVAVTPAEIAGKDRAPTPREMRAMAYLALTHDATGLVYYYYKDIKSSVDSAERWKSVKSLAQEVESISPILLASSIGKSSITSDNPSIHWTAKKRDGKTYIIAVNSSTETQSTILKFRSAVKNARLVKGIGLAYPYNDELLLTLDGYEAVVVELI